jgi:glutathionylspermidine synthase
MQRRCCQPRPDWRDKVEQTGLTYHSHEHGPYWDESAYYELSADEVLTMEAAGNHLHRLCLQAAEAIIENSWWRRLEIPEPAIGPIVRSWERDDFSLYGRFDLAFDGCTPPKLLEYNADTPTALVEAAVTQWFWLRDQHPAADQFNSIHERLIEAWRRWAKPAVHFSGVKDNSEDEMTVLYLRDTCAQAGVATKSVPIEDIGWDERQGRFVDLDLRPIEHCFKLYPWEWLWQEEFGSQLPRDCVCWVEPAWKMLLSNKGLLPILWELFPEHPNLLPAFESPAPLQGRYLRKPKLSREGANITWVEAGVIVAETGGDYGSEGHIFQAPAVLPDFDGHRPVCGLWIVDHEAAGLGIREDDLPITSNLSRFVPHLFR